MKNHIQSWLFVLPLLFVLACESRDSVSQSTAQTNAFTYTAKLKNGQVYLSLNAKAEEVIGPFVKKSDGTYACETQGQGIHSLWKNSSGDWLYSWSYIQMRAEPVDGRALER